MQVHTLAELKRAFSEYHATGGTLTLIRAEGMPNHRYLNVPRKIEKVQTNAIKFEGGSWLEFDKAPEYTFTPNGFIVSGQLEYTFN